MAMALELHRELDINTRVTPVEREMRRRLFWSCYLLDRFMACGSKRPSLIGDKTILLRLPCWAPNLASLPVEGEFFQSASNLQYFHGSGKRCQGSSGMLIDISRILGTTNQYLAAGGVKGDSHFPWHSLSNLSKIRQDLDTWASGTEDVFSSLDALFGQPDSTVLVLSKLIYHLVHCLIYRPFLPIDLSELAGSGQHQSWQIEATNMCFLHANAIAELVELGKQTGSIEWPAFVGYCICTAGTVHIHGAHYSRNGNGGEMSVFSSSAEFLSREMQQLSELRYSWASVQHQRETLQGIYDAHSELVKSLADNPMRYSPVFHLEDFFDRYTNITGPGGQTFSFDAANLSLSDVVVDFTTDTYPGQELFAPRGVNGLDMNGGRRPSLKRKNTAPSGRKRPELKNIMSSLPASYKAMSTPELATPHSFPTSLQPQASPGLLHTSNSITSHHELHEPNSLFHGMQGSISETGSAAVFAHMGAQQRSLHQPAGVGSSSMSASLFHPDFNFDQIRSSTLGGAGSSRQIQQQQQQQQATQPQPQQEGYDPMFGGLPTNAFSSPAPWDGDSGNVNDHGEGENNATKGNDGKSGGRTNTEAGMDLDADNSGVQNINDKSRNGSSAAVGSLSGEPEHDPFLSLLEQLAESESALGGGSGSDLDFFLGLPGGGMIGGGGSGGGT